ncbi:sodium/hydrogen exchanger 9B2 [Copidosoma floridanum]|uniref:sodium/hydrogen exchanger 9B2 n=1 Tax=Copidosoma floridanum TaxID=29053 RepID=UPI000C6F47C4|nr:sodium/hydrogen exchanger 9B2 [Copidosoma floridanum]
MDDLAGRHRRVSISEQLPHQGLDNPAFEHHSSSTGSSNHHNNHHHHHYPPHHHHNHHHHGGGTTGAATADPARKKSILHQANSVPGSVENLHCSDAENNGKLDPRHQFSRKKSALSLSSSIREKVEYTEELKRYVDDRSWLYLFCTRCHGPGDTDSWEPSGWRRACPRPFCPSYRKFARVLCLVLLGLLLWGIVYSIMGSDAAPGGPLFGLACLAIAAHFAGWLFTVFSMPALIGMLLCGILLQNLGLVSIDARYGPVVSDLRYVPANIYYTYRHGIPTLIIAIAGIDDAASVAVYGIIQSVMFSQDALWYQILQGPIAIFGGIGFGVLWGVLSRYVPEKGDPFVVPLRVLMLFSGGLLSVFGSERINLGGAGPLAVVAAAFVSFYFWQKDGLDVEDNPISTSFEIFWMLFEPILFGITGTQIKLNELDGNTVYVAMGCLGVAFIVRMLVTILVGVGSRFNLKEKIFIALACMAKATVQAALGPGTLDKVDHENETQKRYAEIVLMLCVLSILITAPTGAILIMISGPKLLTKTRAPIVTTLHDGWRSRRPSIRDISIIDELPDLEDPKNGTPVITEIITNNQAHPHHINFTNNHR